VCAAFATLPPDGPVQRRSSATDVRRGLKQYFTNPLIVVALFGFLLTYSGGNLILGNLGIYTRDAIGEDPEKYTGLQMALRFGCKSVFGFVLGWLLTRFHPRTPALATTLICIAGVAWAICVPGKWYLFSFGLLGAGELFYVYYLNYIVGCSPQLRVREFTAYSNVMLSVVGFMPLMFGAISGAHGLRMSFGAALAILIAAALIVWGLLPKEPRRAADDDATAG
jgi:MFS family permease